MIDIVYLWVNGNDPQWLAKRNSLTTIKSETTAVNCGGLYTNSDELKYSLRAVEMYAPWIRNIFIVTDNQTPSWLDTTNPRIHVINQDEILPPESNPCFNSNVLEKYLYRIPKLAEHFLYSNDDMFINRQVTPETFFTADGFPITRFQRRPFRRARWWWREKVRRNPLHHYSLAISNAAGLVKRRYGTYHNSMPHHNIDAYLKSDCQRVVENIFSGEIHKERRNHLRSKNDIQRVLFSYVAVSEKRTSVRYPTKKESLHMRIHKDRHYRQLDKHNPLLFCMNDSHSAGNDDRVRMQEVLEKLYPTRSPFEKKPLRKLITPETEPAAYVLSAGA